MSGDVRIGIGYDIHAVVSDRPLVLGGVTIPGDFGLGGHTDGDVVLHALIDALFGAAGLADIGEHFPDGDMALQGISSTVLLEQALEEIERLNWRVNNVDLTILAERPKLSGHKGAIRESLSHLLKIDADSISVKAKTNEGFDAVGRGEAIACEVGLILKRGVD